MSHELSLIKKNVGHVHNVLSTPYNVLSQMCNIQLDINFFKFILEKMEMINVCFNCQWLNDTVGTALSELQNEQRTANAFQAAVCMINKNCAY